MVLPIRVGVENDAITHLDPMSTEFFNTIDWAKFGNNIFTLYIPPICKVDYNGFSPGFVNRIQTIGKKTNPCPDTEALSRCIAAVRPTISLYGPNSKNKETNFFIEKIEDDSNFSFSFDVLVRSLILNSLKSEFISTAVSNLIDLNRYRLGSIRMDNYDVFCKRLINIYEAIPGEIYCLSYFDYINRLPEYGQISHVWLNKSFLYGDVSFCGSAVPYYQLYGAPYLISKFMWQDFGVEFSPTGHVKIKLNINGTVYDNLLDSKSVYALLESIQKNSLKYAPVVSSKLFLSQNVCTLLDNVSIRPDLFRLYSYILERRGIKYGQISEASMEKQLIDKIYEKAANSEAGFENLKMMLFKEKIKLAVPTTSYNKVVGKTLTLPEVQQLITRMPNRDNLVFAAA